MPTHLTDIEITHISLVDKGANQRGIVWKDAGETDASEELRRAELRKVDDEKRLVYGVVYAPDDVDTDGEQATAAEIEKAAHGFMKAARTGSVDKQHDLVADEGFVAESWIVRKDDEHFPDDEGAWAVAIKVEDEETWDEVKKGDIAGISMYGTAQKTEVEKSAGNASNSPRGFQERHDALLEKAEGVQKDFGSEFQRAQLDTATTALRRALDDVLWDYHDTFAEKKGALIEEASAFTDTLNQMDPDAMAKNDDTPTAKELASKVDTLTETVEKLAEQRAKEESKADEGEGVEKGDEPETEEDSELADLSKRLDSLTEQVEDIAKSSAGRQSSDGREETQKSTEPEGLPIIG